MKQKYKIILFVVFGVSIALFLTILIENAKEKRLLRDHLLTNGVIEQVSIHKGTYFANYSFEINGIKRSKKQRINVGNTSLFYLTNFLERKSMIVVYEPKDITNNQMLLEKSDFERFGIKIDSNNYKILVILDSLKIQ